jgi:hypothetical protein
MWRIHLLAYVQNHPLTTLHYHIRVLMLAFSCCSGSGDYYYVSPGESFFHALDKGNNFGSYSGLLVRRLNLGDAFGATLLADMDALVSKPCGRSRCRLYLWYGAGGGHLGSCRALISAWGLRGAVLLKLLSINV